MNLAKTILSISIAASIGCSLMFAQEAAAKSKNKKDEIKTESTTAAAGKSDAASNAEAEAPVTMKDMTNVESLSKWMTFYYLHPQPELLVPALLLADKQGFLEGGAAPPMQAFASRVIAQNPDKLKDWYQQLAPISNNGKTLVLTSIWWSGTKESKELLESIGAQLPEKAKIEFRKQIDNPAPEIDKMAIESPDVVDMLWACFCESGDAKYVKRIATTLTWSKGDTKDLSKMMIASGARWSLISNIKQHSKVKEICEGLVKDPEIKPYMEKVLAEVAGKPTDTAETPAKEKNSADSNKKTSDTTASGNGGSEKKETTEGTAKEPSSVGSTDKANNTTTTEADSKPAVKEASTVAPEVK